MAKPRRNGTAATDSHSFHFSIKMPDGMDEEALADFEDALQEFVGRFGYELVTTPLATAPSVPKAKAPLPVRTAARTAPQ